MSIEDVITESLENDNLQLQNMSGQKYVQTNPMFMDAVAKWQKNLGTVDSVLACWGDVQKKWQALESIFIGSADIRVQLPEDSKRFDMINADFQVSVWEGGGGGKQGVEYQHCSHFTTPELAQALAECLLSTPFISFPLSLSTLHPSPGPDAQCTRHHQRGRGLQPGWPSGAAGEYADSARDVREGAAGVCVCGKAAVG